MPASQRSVTSIGANLVFLLRSRAQGPKCGHWQSVLNMCGHLSVRTRTPPFPTCDVALRHVFTPLCIYTATYLRLVLVSVFFPGNNVEDDGLRFRLSLRWSHRSQAEMIQSADHLRVRSCFSCHFIYCCPVGVFFILMLAFAPVLSVTNAC